jgi:hypothetical protein
MAKTKILDKDGQPIDKKTEVAEVVKLPAQAENLMAVLMRVASDPTSQPDKMRALLDMRNELMAQEAEVMFTEAFIQMHADLPIINKDGRIEIPAKKAPSPGGRPSGKQDTPYATYPNIQKHTDPVLKKHRFALILQPEPREGGGILMKGELSFVCETQYGRLVHHKRCVIPVPLEAGGSKNDAQGISSSLAYGKRNARIILLDIITLAKDDQEKELKTPVAASPKQPEAEETALISQDQADKLIDEIEACGVSREIFCKKFAVKAVAELPAEKYADAIEACRAYAARKGQ